MKKFASVISEDLDGAIKLTNSLLSPLPASIGLLGAVPELGISHERERGFRAALRSVDMQAEPLIRPMVNILAAVKVHASVLTGLLVA